MSDPVIPEPPHRPAPPQVSGERAALEGWLDFHRATLLTKCAGLTGEELARRSCPPSGLSLLGLVRHLTEVERGWFLRRWVPGTTFVYCRPDGPDADLEETDPGRAADDVAAYLAAVQECRAEAARHELDETVDMRPENPSAGRIDVRWIYLHMIEEYARHNGHADLLREAVDGTAGV